MHRQDDNSDGDRTRRSCQPDGSGDRLWCERGLPSIGDFDAAAPSPQVSGRRPGLPGRLGPAGGGHLAIDETRRRRPLGTVAPSLDPDAATTLRLALSAGCARCPGANARPWLSATWPVSSVRWRSSSATTTARGRDDERHENVLVDTTRLPHLLADNGADAVVSPSFGGERLPVGLRTVVGRRRPEA